MIAIIRAANHKYPEIESLLTESGEKFETFYDLKSFLQKVLSGSCPFSIVDFDHPHPRTKTIALLLETAGLTRVIGVNRDFQKVITHFRSPTNPKEFSEVPFEKQEFIEKSSEYSKQHQIKLGLSNDFISVTGKLNDESQKAREELKSILRVEKSSSLTSEPAIKSKVYEKSKTHVVCLLVNAGEFKGYLVAAIGGNRSYDQDFQEQIKDRLLSFLSKSSEPFEDFDFFKMSLEEVPFIDWAERQAEFLKQTIHQGDEIAIAFFPRPSPINGSTPAGTSNMVRISVEEIKPNEPVKFDVYLHLPINHKYLLYLEEGSKFHLEQKTRLKQRGVGHFHLKRESIKALKRFRAETFLNEQIKLFKTYN